MLHPEQHFRWTWDLAAPPEALWPLVSNTDRFNRDCGYPPVTIVPPPRDESASAAGLVTNYRRLRAHVMGIAIEWEELAFVWEAPHRFGVERTWYSGPVARMVMCCELRPRTGGGTALAYDMRLTRPACWAGWRCLF